MLELSEDGLGKFCVRCFLLSSFRISLALRRLLDSSVLVVVRLSGKSSSSPLPPPFSVFADVHGHSRIPSHLPVPVCDRRARGGGQDQVTERAISIRPIYHVVFRGRKLETQGRRGKQVSEMILSFTPCRAFFSFSSSIQPLDFLMGTPSVPDVMYSWLG